MQETSVCTPKEIKNFKSLFVSCGYYHSVGIQNGQLFTWGKNDSGQLGIGNFSQRELIPTLVKDLSD
jgi:alpha-tubulin suppressor-like RCC1 family protein